MDEPKKLKSCITRNTKEIKTELSINGTKLIFSQRLLKLDEQEKGENLKVNIYDDVDVFHAQLEGELCFKDLEYKDIAEDEKDKYISIIHKLKTARDKISINQLIYQKYMIACSVMPMKIYGGSLLVDDILVDKLEDIEEYIDLLRQDEFDNLYINTINLTYPTEEEVEEIKK